MQAVLGFCTLFFLPFRNFFFSPRLRYWNFFSSFSTINFFLLLLQYQFFFFWNKSKKQKTQHNYPTLPYRAMPYRNVTWPNALRGKAFEKFFEFHNFPAVYVYGVFFNFLFFWLLPKKRLPCGHWFFFFNFFLLWFYYAEEAVEVFIRFFFCWAIPPKLVRVPSSW